MPSFFRSFFLLQQLVCAGLLTISGSCGTQGFLQASDEVTNLESDAFCAWNNVFAKEFTVIKHNQKKNAPSVFCMMLAELFHQAAVAHREVCLQRRVRTGGVDMALRNIGNRLHILAYQIDAATSEAFFTFLKHEIFAILSEYSKKSKIEIQKFSLEIIQRFCNFCKDELSEEGWGAAYKNALKKIEQKQSLLPRRQAWVKPYLDSKSFSSPREFLMGLWKFSGQVCRDY